ncbi:MAG: efflux RND transporter periplasmic adaptor subunit [Planctomycetota bacterium]
MKISLRPLVALSAVALLLAARLPSDPAGQTFSAIVQPRAQVELAPDAEGVVAEVLVERGKQVRAGDLLVRLESRVEEAELAAARARAAANAVVEGARLDVAQLELELKRSEELGRSGFESAENQDAARFELERARAALVAAEVEQELAVHELARTEARVARRELRAPWDGVVTERQVEVGQLVIRGGRVSLLQISTLDDLVADLRLPAELHGRVRAGDAVTVHGPKGAVVEATIEVVDRAIDPSSGTFRVRVALAQDGPPIPSGSRVEIELGGLQ